MVYVPYLAILLAFLQIHIPRQIVGAEMTKLAGGYDNRDPRGQQTQLDGRGKRALAAHHNGFEAFAPFAVAVLASIQRGASIELIGGVAIGFVVVRTIYVLAYLADKPALRSGMWGLGMLATIGLFGLAIVG